MNNALSITFPFSIVSSFDLKRVLKLRYLLVLSVASALLMAGFYIFQVNAIISEGYSINDYQSKLTQLSQDNKRLEVSSLKSNSLNITEQKIQELGFEKIDKINYIQLIDNQVVTK